MRIRSRLIVLILVFTLSLLGLVVTSCRKETAPLPPTQTTPKLTPIPKLPPDPSLTPMPTPAPMLPPPNIVITLSTTIENGTYRGIGGDIVVNGNYLNVISGSGVSSYSYKLLEDNLAEITYLQTGVSKVRQLYQMEGTGNLVYEGGEYVKVK